jgi:CHAD domain-containing protein
MAKAFKIRKVSPDDDSRAAAVRIMRTRLREFFSHWRDPDAAPEAAQLHALRISGKRLRYSAESLREFYPDRLVLLLNLLRQLQDLLGEMQDYETQRAIIESDLARLRKISEKGQQGRVITESEIAAVENLIRDAQLRQEKRLAEFTLLWRGISDRKFRRALKDLISHPLKAVPADDELPDQD